MLEASVLQKIARRARKAGVVVLLVSILVPAGVVAFGAGITVESLQIGLVAGTSQVDRAKLGLDKGVIGDTVRVSALVKNTLPTAVGEFPVQFYFTETISGEHGLLGTQFVSGLESGEEKRPVVLFDTSALAPGIYAFSAEADPQNTLQDADRCDNVTPRGSCSLAGAEAADKYSLTLLREGRHILWSPSGDVFPVCRMGPLQDRVQVQLYNVGTETLSGSDLVVYGYYRLSLTAPANDFRPLVADASGNPTPLQKFGSLGSPGKEGYLLITLKYDALSREFAPQSIADEEPGQKGNVLGHAAAAQIRLTIQPVGGGTSQDVFMPDQFQLSQFYSAVDLWTFPARSACCSENCDAVASISVKPVVSGGVVFHAARGTAGDSLYSLRVSTGEKIGSWSVPAGKTLAATATTYDDETKTWRVFCAVSDGKVYALLGVEKDKGDFLTTLWTSADAELVKGLTYLSLSADAKELVIGSEYGAFIVDAETGTTLREVGQYGAVTTAPAFVDSTGALWFVTDETLHGMLANRTESTFDAQDRITTDLALNASSTAVFFGTQSGDVYAMDASVTAGARTPLDQASAARSVVGLTLVSKSDDAILYAAGDIGEMARIEYRRGRGFENVDELETTSLYSELRPWAIDDAPALLPNKDNDEAVVVLAAAEVREGKATRPILLGWTEDLTANAEVSVWGVKVPFAFEPEEGGAATGSLLGPVVWADELEPTYSDRLPVVLVAASDGRLYAFDLSQFVAK